MLIIVNIGGIMRRIRTTCKCFILMFCMIASCFFPTICFASEWNSFPIQWDDSVASSTDVSTMVLDAPAGKHGFVKVKNGDFYFDGDETKVKFWGVNVTFKGAFPDKEIADKTAAHLAKSGFNCVRIHHIDTYESPRGIFASGLENTLKFDPEQLDRLDYFIHALKEKGIYVNLNLHVARTFKSGDSVEDAANLPENSKIVTLFDDRLIELQKDYAQKLLTHYNPYTQNEYRNEPAIAMIEITNENSIFPAWSDGILLGREGEQYYKALPQFYVDELDDKWNAWLKERYETTDRLREAWGMQVDDNNYIKNGDFEQDLAGTWEGIHYLGTSAQFTKDSTDKASGEYSECVVIDETTGIDYDVQLRQLGLNLDKGKKFTLSFYAKSDSEKDIAVRFTKHIEPYTNYGLEKTVSLNSEWQRYTMDFVSSQTDENTRLSFNLGNSVGKVWVDQVELVEQEMSYLDEDESLEEGTVKRTDWKERFERSDQRIADNTRFYYELEKMYFEGMLGYLHNTLGVKVPVSTSNMFYGFVDLKAQSVGDFMNMHSYFDHPTFNGGEWDDHNYEITNESLINSLGSKQGEVNFSSFIEKMGLCSVLGKPTVVSEWNMSYPNQYEYEAMPTITAYAMLQGCDALFLYYYANDLQKVPDSNRIEDALDVMNNSVKMSQAPFCSLMFIRDDIKIANRKITLNLPVKDLIRDYKYIGESRKFPLIGGYIPSSVMYYNRINLSPDESLDTTPISDVFTSKQLEELQTKVTHISDTEEIELNHDILDKGYLRINTERAQGAAGFLSNHSVKTDNMKLDLDTDASCLLVSMDGNAINQSKRMILSVSARQKNEGEQSGVWGTGPVLVERVKGTVEIRVDEPSSYIVYALDSTGVRTKLIPHIVEDNRLSITLNEQTLWYEVVGDDENIEPEDTKPEDSKPENIEPEDTKPEDIEPVNIEPVNIKPENIEPVNIEPEDIPPTSATLNKTKCYIKQGDSYSLVLSVKPQNHTYPIYWKSSNDSIATVNNKGVVKAISPGKVQISAKVSKIETTCEVYVVDKETGFLVELIANQVYTAGKLKPLVKVHDQDRLLKNSIMLISEMAKTLGIHKTDSYWLVHKNIFKTFLVSNRIRVDMASFEEWYASQIRNQ